MRTLYAVQLNGIELDAIDPRIHTVAVEEQAPKIKIVTLTKTIYDGLRVVRRERESRSIVITLVLWERDKAERFALYSQLVEWADGGGVLCIGYRNAQQINVCCEKLPDIDGREWRDEIELTLTAYNPYWRGIDPALVSVTTKAAEAAMVTMRPNGSAKITFLEFEIRNNGTAAMTSATIAANGLTFTLAGFSLASGKTLKAAYDDNGFLSFTADGASIAEKRSADSADDLLLEQRQDNAVSVTTNQPAKVTLMAWEQWL
ncbi:MAG: hypothetical protein RR301_08135 [Clostridia bacterium]